jgi:uncharacterized protein (TIGR01777 family)
LRVTVTGASGLIGEALVTRLAERGDEVTILTRDPDRVREQLGDVTAVAWDPRGEPAPAAALQDRAAIVHLAGENVAQRWSSSAKRAIRESRVTGTRNLVEGLRALDADARPAVLVSSSAIGYYGARGEEPLDEDAPPGGDFLARVCVEWEEAARTAERLSTRVVTMRTGVVLDPRGGALAKMLTPFRLGLGGPIAGGAQYMSWIHLRDLVAMMLAAVERSEWSGPVNATAPAPVTNREFSKTLGRVLHRPAMAPLPALALRLAYGEMAQVLTTGARVVPARALVLGYSFAHPELEGALGDLLS